MARSRAPGRRDEVQVAHVVEKFASLFDTASELAEGLQVSAAAVSTSTTFLLQVGLVEKLRLPGERRDRYHLPDDAWYLATASKDALYGRIAEMAAEAARLLRVPRARGARAGRHLARRLGAPSQAHPPLTATQSETRVTADPPSA